MNLEKLNDASKEELAKVRGIGSERAEEIVKLRSELGGFKNMEDLKKIPGFGEEMLPQLMKDDGGMFNIGQ